MSLTQSICAFQVAEKTSLLRPVELKLVPVALEGSAFRSKFLDTDELMSYCSFFAVCNISISAIIIYQENYRNIFFSLLKISWTKLSN